MQSTEGYEQVINHLGRQFTATLRPKLDPSMYPLEQMGCFLLSTVRHNGSSHRDETIPDFRQRVELPHEARVEVHRRVQPTVSVHSLDLGAVLGVLVRKYISELNTAVVGKPKQFRFAFGRKFRPKYVSVSVFRFQCFGFCSFSAFG